MSPSLARMRRTLDRWRGLAVVTDLGPLREGLAAITARGEELSSRSDEELRGLARSLRERTLAGVLQDQLETEAFALVREAAVRTLGLRPFDVQVLAGLAMKRGALAEMQTGEGKTLAAVFPAFLSALGGEGVHVMTFNDYLARRDAAWMGPLYRFLGLEVGVIQEGMDPATRRRAYAADVTYLTARESGFDLLRDSLRTDPGDLVHRPFRFALVDEADSLLIDEARVPLIIAGSEEQGEDSALLMADLVCRLEPGVHYRRDEYARAVDLTDEGLRRAETLLGVESLHDPENLARLTELNCALHAAVLLRRDVDYIVREGAIQLVDEFTGRVVEDRHWPDGLQVAVEAREGLERRPEGRVLGSITVQHLLALYPRICGMTGTAVTAAEELELFYGLRVMVIPTNRPCLRRDLPDLVFTHRAAKTRALVREIRRVHRTGRPVLVGTLSVAESEALAAALAEAGVPCEVLNARTDELEARIVARAGAHGAVTISTNMAGRGTDIRLGGPAGEDRERVAALGGLYVIGTDRHESLRIDRQLRGRAGRQGDPGSSRFFTSLEDDLIVRYGIRGLIPARLWPERQEKPLDNPVVRREIARAQRIIEGQSFEIRRTLRLYSNQIERQRRLIQGRRRRLLLDDEEASRLEEEQPALFEELRAEVGEDGLRRAERQATLHHLDRRWSEQLARIADLREGIHLHRIGGRDPLNEFIREAVASYCRMVETIDADVRDTLRSAALTPEGLDLDREGLRGPSSTWTYLVNDDPFEDQLGLKLAGNLGVAAAAALYVGPLLILWGLWRRLGRRRVRRGRRRADPRD